MKRLGGFVFALLLLLTLAPWGNCAGAETRSGTYGENIRWELDSGTGTLTLSGSGAMEYLDDTPWWHIRQEVRYLVIGDGITKVSARAFYYSENLEEVILPEGLEVIGDGAFAYCRRLAKINFPDSLRYISNEAFYCCVSLEEAVLPENLKSIGSEAFFGCRALKSLQIPCVASLGNGAFSGCVALEEAQVAKGVTLLPSRLFENCTSLKTVLIPESVRTIAADAFLGCTALENPSLTEEETIPEEETAPEEETTPEEPAPEKGVTWEFDAKTGTLTISGKGFLNYYKAEWHSYRDQIRHLVVTGRITGIGSAAFRNYEALETVEINYGLEEIRNEAFQGCTSLKEVRLPESLEHLGYRVFQNCTALKKLVFPDRIISIPSGICYGCTSLEEVVLPTNLEYINGWAFCGCTSLEEIILPANLHRIDGAAFYDCESLSNVKLPRYGVIIEDSAFFGCPVPVSLRLYIFAQNYGRIIIPAVWLLALVILLILWCRAKGSRKKLLGRVMGVCIWTLLALTAVFSLDKMGLLQVTKAYGSPLMWLPSLLPEPWDEIVVEYLNQLLQWFYIAMVVFGIAVHQWFCTSEALRSSGELPRGAGFARTGVLAGGFGGLALWCYLAWRGRQEGWGSYEEMSVLFPVGILCGLAAVLLPGWKRGRALLRKNRKIMTLGVGMIIGIWLLSPLPGIAEEYGGSIGEVLRMGWDIGLLILAVICGAFAVYFLARALYSGWKYRDQKESTVDWGRIARIGIIVAAVVIGYMIFCVLARGNVKSEYFAEQITVTHVYEDSGEQTIYCVDFIREELQFYTEDADGNRELHWTKPLTTGALDEFVETCNREELLGSDEYALYYSPASGWRLPEVYCYVTTYSVKGEREVFSNRHPYLDSDLPVKLNQAFYELTGIYCLDTP